jgi:hypothetical protein
VVRNRDSNFEREIAVFSYPQAGVVTGGIDSVFYNSSKRCAIILQNSKSFTEYKFSMIFHIFLSRFIALAMHWNI